MKPVPLMISAAFLGTVAGIALEVLLDSVGTPFWAKIAAFICLGYLCGCFVTWLFDR